MGVTTSCTRFSSAMYRRMVDCASVGFDAAQNANLEVENCCVRDCGGGVMAFDKGHVQVIGDTYLRDCATMGLFALLDGTILVTPWEDHNDFSVLEIRTTKPAAETTAILAMQRGTVAISTGDLMPVDGAVLVKIIDQTDLAGSEKHQGVVLGSKGMVTGKKNIVFRESGVNDGADTIAAAQQFMQTPDENTLLLD